MSILLRFQRQNNVVVRDKLSMAFTLLLFVIVCLCWGTTWLGIRIAVESIPPLTSAGLRFLIAFPLFLLFALIRGDALLFPGDRKGFFILVTLGYFGVPYYLLNYGEQYVSSGLTALIFSAMPVFIVIFSFFLLQEKIYKSQLAGITIGFISLLMVVRSQRISTDFSEVSGVVAILIAAVMHACCYVITRQRGSHIGVVTYNTLPIGIAGAGLLLAGVMTEAPDLSAVTLRSWMAVTYLGMVASVGGFIVYFYLLKRISAVVLSFVFIIFPVIAIFLGAWYEQTPLSAELVLYTLLLLAGFALTRFPLEKFHRKRS